MAEINSQNQGAGQDQWSSLQQQAQSAGILPSLPGVAASGAATGTAGASQANLTAPKDTLGSVANTTQENTAISGNPASPSIPAPSTSIQQAGTNSGAAVAGSTTLHNNPFYSVSFIAVLSSIENNIASMNNKGAYIDAQNDLQTRAQQLINAKAEAELTVDSANAEANIQMNNAINSFMSAAMNAVSIGMTVRTARTANKSYDSEVKAQDKAVREAGAKPLTTDSKDPTEIENANKNNEEYKALKEQQSRLKSPVGKAEHIQKTTQNLDSQTKMLTDMGTSIINGWTSANNAVLTSQKGAIDAMKIGIQAQQKALDSHASNVKDSRQAAQQAIDAAMQSLTKIVDAVLAPHSYLG